MPFLHADDLRNLGIRSPARDSEEMREDLFQAICKGTIPYQDEDPDPELRAGTDFLTNREEIKQAFGDPAIKYLPSNEFVDNALHKLPVHWVISTHDGTHLCGPLPILPVMMKENIYGAAHDSFRPRQVLQLHSIDENKLKDQKNWGLRKSLLFSIQKFELDDVKRNNDGHVRWEGERFWLNNFEPNTKSILWLPRGMYLYLPNGFRKDLNGPCGLLLGYHNCLLDASLLYRCRRIKTLELAETQLEQDLKGLGERGSLRKLLEEKYQLVVNEGGSDVQYDHPDYPSNEIIRRLGMASNRPLNNERLEISRRTNIWTQTASYSYRDKGKAKSGKSWPILEVNFEAYCGYVSLRIPPEK